VSKIGPIYVERIVFFVFAVVLWQSIL